MLYSNLEIKLVGLDIKILAIGPTINGGAVLTLLTTWTWVVSKLDLFFLSSNLDLFSTTPRG